ncbi:sugar phosphate nucleotidyltransferase [Helicobacter bizzozeronii]|uniref:sugar phosphate nucleotidyltransferase n=1 Tax=Helicobacter bizzozeronii TaxID=56877 RepID=UPI000CF095CB|nr:sugar phosphate nucleotidyltransferase [Helicobacter bizzozeronii]
MVHVILSGGSGKRLWPLSRSHFPKQFLKLYDSKSLFGLALDRLDHPQARFLVVCNETHYFHALEEMSLAHVEDRSDFLLESTPKNTMNALILASLACDSQEILVVSPTDHLMDKQAFQKALEVAIQHAQEDKTMLFGIDQEPSSQYGLITCAPLEGEIAPVLGFVEKPSSAQIAQLKAPAQGHFYTNSGMFVFKAGVFLQACAQHAPHMLQACQEIFKQAKRLPHIIKCETQDLEEGGSVDVCLWQKCPDLFVVPLKANWRDVGHFTSLKQSLPADSQHNTPHTSKPVLFEHATHNYVYSHKFSALLGVHGLVVVDTKDGLLIAHQDHLDKLPTLLTQITQKHPDLVHNYPLEYRPWGSFEVLLECPFFKVKLLKITPHKRLSLQRHQHRSEHWVVVEGVASVVVGDRCLQVATNESVFIKQGQIHRLGNDTNEPLTILEVQCGACLDESDIERLEDDYKRP